MQNSPVSSNRITFDQKLILSTGISEQNPEDSPILGNTVCTATDEQVAICCADDRSVAQLERSEKRLDIRTLLSTDDQPKEASRQILHKATAKFVSTRSRFERRLLVFKYISAGR